MKRLAHSAATELEMLRQAVAASPIRVSPWPLPRAIAPDWENVRHSSNVDAFVLTWIASHVRRSGDRRAH